MVYTCGMRMAGCFCLIFLLWICDGTSKPLVNSMTFTFAFTLVGIGTDLFAAFTFAFTFAFVFACTLMEAPRCVYMRFNFFPTFACPILCVRNTSFMIAKAVMNSFVNNCRSTLHNTTNKTNNNNTNNNLFVVLHPSNI